ncbi:hypothetical protein L6452_44074 [Arctium lappa]|uniref:Uncharacterized protein n=1 Tax=Arctium lappa TaxID=4217 RepID=A0ACB8XES5_ARCLA|nr:hypothetical protein L6452_44074 [Arctium lappa]
MDIQVRKRIIKGLDGSSSIDEDSSSSSLSSIDEDLSKKQVKRIRKGVERTIYKDTKQNEAGDKGSEDDWFVEESRFEEKKKDDQDRGSIDGGEVQSVRKTQLTEKPSGEVPEKEEEVETSKEKGDNMNSAINGEGVLVPEGVDGKGIAETKAEEKDGGREKGSTSESRRQESSEPLKSGVSTQDETAVQNKINSTDASRGLEEFDAKIGVQWGNEKEEHSRGRKE